MPIFFSRNIFVSWDLPFVHFSSMKMSSSNAQCDNNQQNNAQMNSIVQQTANHINTQNWSGVRQELDREISMLNNNSMIFHEIFFFLVKQLF